MFQLFRFRNDVVYVEGIDVNRCLPTAGDNVSLLICSRNNRWKKRGICVAPVKHLVGYGFPIEQQVRLHIHYWSRSLIASNQTVRRRQLWRLESLPSRTQ